MTLKTWISNYRKSVNHNIEQVILSELQAWRYDKKKGIVCRNDDAFFSIKAINASRNINKYNELPLINQCEIGILGFILSRSTGVEKIILQAKSEPGNVGITQIGPSVQATESNYKSKHKGKEQKYIEYFLDPKYPRKISLKQSEQGTRFLNKYNLNAIVEVDESQIIIDEEKYKWYGIDEIIAFLNEDFLFNTDFKSVFAHLLEEIILGKSKHLKKNKNPFLNSYFNHIGDDISPVILSIHKIRIKNKFEITEKSLTELKNWHFTNSGIQPENPLDHGFNFFSDCVKRQRSSGLGTTADNKGIDRTDCDVLF